MLLKMGLAKSCLAFCLVISLTSIIKSCECSLAMKRLYEELFTDYNRLILPVANNGSKVTVTLGLKLGQILDLNLKQQILSTNVWVEQSWHDYRLEWAPELYEGIDMIHVPAENIWVPDIVLFNNADGNYELTLVAKATLYSNGSVVWRPPTMFRSTCEIDVEYFPFDIQTCFLRFGSWTYAGDELELRHVANKTKAEIGIDLSQFYKNVEWDIIDVPAYYNEFFYECCSEPFPDITFKIVIRRKMLFYLVNLILPVGLMTFMTVLVFYLPSDSNEKVTLSISILTSLIVFFLLMLEIIPASSLAVPLFGKYLLFTLVLVSLSACVSVFVLNIYHRSPSVHPMSPRVRRIFLNILPRILRLDRPDPSERSSLNRFRKKKIAQQMLNPTNKGYDFVQPLATSLNLIETLNESYNINPKPSSGKRNSGNLYLGANESDDEGRYFRRYVDDYIESLKKSANSNSQRSNGPTSFISAKPTPKACGKSTPCCTMANQPLAQTSSDRQYFVRHQMEQKSNYGLNRLASEWTESSIDTMCPLVPKNKAPQGYEQTSIHCMDCSGMVDKNTQRMSRLESNQTATLGKSSSFGCTGRLSQLCNNNIHQRLLNDDTLDMTFDCEDEEPLNESSSFQIRANNGGLTNKVVLGPTGYQHPRTGRCPAADDLVLPSPPPPPRQLTQLSCDSLAAIDRSCTSQRYVDASQEVASMDGTGTGLLGENGKLVEKLLSSINLINNASDEIDITTATTATTSSGSAEANDSLGANNGAMGSDCSNGCQHIDQLRRRRVPSTWSTGCADIDIDIHGQANFGDQQALRSSLHQLRHPMQGQFGQNHQDDTKCSCPRESLRVSRSQTGVRVNTKVAPRPVLNQPSDLLLSLRLPYDQMPAHVRAAIRSILFIADTIKNEDDENSAIEDWELVSMVVDRLALWIFLLLCTFGSLIILALAPSLYDQRASIDDKLRVDIPPSNCSASVYAQG